jgi:hypothetical protein
VNLGDTFVIEHLWIVATLPASDGSVAMVTFTTWRSPNDDESCIVLPGEHRFVRHKTIVAYKHARVFPPDAQARLLSVPEMCRAHDPVTPKLLDRIQRGALTSDFTPGAVQSLVRESMARQRRR